MKLTELECLLLHNQLQILMKIDQQNSDEYELLLNCLYNGYLDDFEQLLPNFEQPLPREIREEVREILQMFRALTPLASERHLSRPYAKFAGFDGNEETKHYAYAKFLLEDMKLWSESQSNSYNTHARVLPKYRRMLAAWHEMNSPWELSNEQLELLTKLAPYESTVNEGGAND